MLQHFTFSQSTFIPGEKREGKAPPQNFFVFHPSLFDIPYFTVDIIIIICGMLLFYFISDIKKTPEKTNSELLFQLADDAIGA